MSNWRDEYFAALVVRDEREKANISLYDAYTRLANRAGRLETTSHEPPPPSSPSPLKSPRPSSTAVGKQPAKREPTPQEQTPSKNQNLAELLSAARKDLTDAQKARAELLDRQNKTAAELEKLKKKTGLDAQRLADLAVERTQLQQKLRDRDEELRGKAKLLDDVQSELVSLNLQFNMADERSKKLENDNRELVDRWMARMGEEADALNKASKFS